MKTRTILSLLLTMTLSVFAGCAGEGGTAPLGSGESTKGDDTTAETQHVSPPQSTQTPEEKVLYIGIGDKTLTVRPAGNSSAEALIELLKQGDITVAAHDYGGFEKVGPLGTSLPTNDERITTEPGDLILYQGDQLTLYYDVNTWSFTRLGRVEGLSAAELREILGTGDVTMVLSLTDPNA